MPRAEGRRVEKMSDDKEKEVGFYNVHDGLKGRDGGPYLDHIERQAAEVARARLEDREPADPWGVLPATAGTPLLVASQIVDNSLTSNPSMASKPTLAAVLDDEALGKGKPWGELSDVSFTSPVSVAKIDTRTEVEEEEEDHDLALDNSNDSVKFENMNPPVNHDVTAEHEVVHSDIPEQRSGL